MTLVTINQAAQLLGLRPNRISGWTLRYGIQKRGRHGRAGLFDLEELKAMQAKCHSTVDMRAPDGAITISETMVKLRCGRDTIYRLIRENALRALTLHWSPTATRHFIVKASIDEYLATCKPKEKKEQEQTAVFCKPRLAADDSVCLQARRAEIEEKGIVWKGFDEEREAG
jgi:hypothetical protein